MIKRKFDISSAALHIIAMFFMLLDHMWATVIPGNGWMTSVGRIAFPIFAFMVAEGCYYTHDIKRYALRMLCFALISEVPFDLMSNGLAFFPYHQNVMWTFLFAILGIWMIENARKAGRIKTALFRFFAFATVGMLLGTIIGLDYYAAGVPTVFMFYYLRERKPLYMLLQFAAMWWLNVEIMGGFYYPVTILGHEFEIVRQSFALFALIPIWLYKGRQGYHSKAFQYGCYAFYPVHMLILWIIMESRY